MSFLWKCKLRKYIFANTSFSICKFTVLATDIGWYAEKRYFLTIYENVIHLQLIWGIEIFLIKLMKSQNTFPVSIAVFSRSYFQVLIFFRLLVTNTYKVLLVVTAFSVSRNIIRLEIVAFSVLYNRTFVLK